MTIHLIEKYGTSCTVDGVSDVARIGPTNRRSTQPWVTSALRRGFFRPTSPVIPGSIVVTSTDSYIVEAIYRSLVGDNIHHIEARMIRVNQSINILRLTQTFDTYGNPALPTWTSVATNVKAVGEYITVALRADDPGLLPATVYTIYLQNISPAPPPLPANSPVPLPPDSPVLVGPDRITFGGRNYLVEAADAVKLPGLLVCQVSIDLRA